MTARPTVCVSVDLDAVECYFRIHALPGPPPEGARFAILRRCLPRFAELFARHGVRATFFVVGRDLDEDSEGRRLLAELAGDGHELANHSHTHPYDLVRLGSQRIRDEIESAHNAIAACAGGAPSGFRAPGYEVSSDVIQLLCDRGYLYDSSAFPSVPYYAAKSLVMAAIRITGGKSGSTIGSPGILLAPLQPYHPGKTNPYKTGGQPILELPITVTPSLRLPVIGTAVVTAPEWLRHSLVAAALQTPFFNFELHGIDLADASNDEFPTALIARQPDLRVSLAKKLTALGETLQQARAAGAEFRTLREFATNLNATPSAKVPG